MLPLDEEETYTLLFNRKVWKGIWHDCYPKVTFSFFALVPQHSLELELMSLMWYRRPHYCVSFALGQTTS
jgi:hypothetical protein